MFTPTLIVPHIFTKSLNKRLEFIDQKISTKKIQELLAKTSAVTRTSVRGELKTAATWLQMGEPAFLTSLSMLLLYTEEAEEGHQGTCRQDQG